MSLKDNLLIFFCFFPVFIFRSNFSSKEILIIIFFFILFILVLFFFNNILNRKNLTKIKIVFICIVITYGIDNHLGLFNGLILPNESFLKIFKIIYIPAILLLFLIFFANYFFFIYSKEKQKVSIIFLIFIFTLFIFNIFDNTKSYKKIPNVIKKTEYVPKTINLILILDEMSGLNSAESNSILGKQFVNLAEKYFEDNNFEYYPNAFSTSKNSVTAISSLINLIERVSEEERKKFAKKSGNYFIDYDLLDSKLFEKFNSISVFQNMHVNYCQLPNVKKCKQFNPFETNEFLKGFKNNFLTKYFSFWHLNGSILGKFFWRTGKQLRITDSLSEPEGQKASIAKTLREINNDISKNKFDLIFAHLLFPHTPYGLDENCKYSGNLSNMNNFFSKNKKTKIHNIERKCVLIFLDNFLQNISNNKNLRVILLSDHGSRIEDNPESSNSIIFAVKNLKSKKGKKNNIKISSQKIFIDLYGKK